MPKLKRDMNGTIARFKARLVVWNYFQQFKINFDWTFTIVIKPITFRILFAITTYYNLNINQIDIKIAFFYTSIDLLVHI